MSQQDISQQASIVSQYQESTSTFFPQLLISAQNQFNDTVRNMNEPSSVFISNDSIQYQSGNQSVTSPQANIGSGKQQERFQSNLVSTHQENMKNVQYEHYLDLPQAERKTWRSILNYFYQYNVTSMYTDSLTTLLSSEDNANFNVLKNKGYIKEFQCKIIQQHSPVVQKYKKIITIQTNI